MSGQLRALTIHFGRHRLPIFLTPRITAHQFYHGHQNQPFILSPPTNHTLFSPYYHNRFHSSSYLTTFTRPLFSSSGSSSSSIDSKQPDENPNPGLAWFVAGLVLLSAGFILFSSRFLTGHAPPILSFEDFFRLLERGEVKNILLSHQSPLAFVTLYSDYPGSDKQIVLVPIGHGPEQFEKMVREKEAAWGIRGSECIPIHFGNPHDLNLGQASTLTSLILAFVLTVTMVVLYLYWLRKTGKLPPGILNSTTTSQSAKESKSEPTTRTERIDPFERKESTDRYRGGAGMPFNFDPFTGMQSIKPVTTNVRFKDVAGMHASKQEVMEIVSYLKDSRKYELLGAKLPKGALLLGPPGTGKTLLVKALANEANVPFFSMAGSEFVEVIGGLGASRIRQLFRTARAHAPSIIFIDELDSLGRRRSNTDVGGRRGKGGGGGGGGGGVGEMEQTLNQLLVEMDGMDTTEGTIVFAATNRADLLDKALLRAGRFDRHIYVDLPNMAERKELFAMYMSKYALSPTILQGELIERLSTWTPGMSGADIARLCNEAALVAARSDHSMEGVMRDDFEYAFERILAGAAKQSNPLSPPERRVAAVQEAGRTLIAWLLPKSRMLPIKVSIVPRTMAGMEEGVGGGLGFTHLVPEDRRLFDTDELADRMAVMLGGRAAEQVIFNAVSDASQRYLRNASNLALKQVRELGLSKVIGHLSYATDPSGSEYTMKPYSQRTQAMIELEAQQLVTNAFQRCVNLLQANKDRLQRLIEALLDKEVLNYDELVAICAERGPDKSTPKP